MIDEKAAEFYKNMWSYPANNLDLADFAKQILEEFVSDLEKNAYGVVWNYGCDSVIFTHRSLEGRVSLREMKEKYLAKRSNESNSDESHGTGDQGHSVADEKTRMETEQPKGSSEI